MKWQFTLDGVVIDSRSLQPGIKITGPAGVAQCGQTGTSAFNFNPGAPGSSSFQPPTLANGWTWQFNWQTSCPGSTTALKAGTYQVSIGPTASGAWVGGPYAVTLK
jgi:hypothetical protein